MRLAPLRPVVLVMLAVVALGRPSAAVALHPAVAWSEALKQAAYAGDFTRVLADGPPELWDEAAQALLDKDGKVSGLALPVVLRRLEGLGPETRFRVSSALLASNDPRVLPLLARLAHAPLPDDDARLTRLAAERFADPIWRTALERQSRGEEPFPLEPPPPPPDEADARRQPPAAAWKTAGLVLMLLVSGWLGLVLFLWGFRLLGLRRLVRGLAVSPARSVALGQVALQGEAQPLDGASLTHPETGELCLYFDGAKENTKARFVVVDDTGRVPVALEGGALLSADGVIVPGERVHIIGEARPVAGANGEVVVGIPARGRSAFQTIAQALVGSVMGGLFGRGSARMLFTDPLHCFWIWDDLQVTPFSSFRETAWLVAAFVLGGSWVIVFFVAAAALLGR